jgi:hypothetical protein
MGSAIALVMGVVELVVLPPELRHPLAFYAELMLRCNGEKQYRVKGLKEMRR